MVEERAPAIPPRGVDLSGLWSLLAVSHRTLVLPAATAFAAMVAWQAVVTYGQISPAILPPPTMVLEQLVTNFWLILKHTIPTTYETLLAFGISIPLGIALAALMVYSATAYQALYPNVIFFQLIPKIALAPLFIAWLGISPSSRITFAIFICFFPILIATVTGLRSVDANMLRLCRSLRMSNWQVLVRVRFPSALTLLFSGMKVAVTL